MEALLWTLFGLTALVALIVIVALFIVVRTVRRSSRVVPEVRGPAPLSWQASVRRPARLHRRLQQSVSSVRLALDASTTSLDLQSLVAELESHACALDEQLVLAARAPSAQRGRLLNELDGESAALSEAARRIIQLARQPDGGQRAIDRIADRLDALDAALHELDGQPMPRLPRPQSDSA
ncbi:MAG: hypothetical protein ACR2H3_07710 [Acidimicrobiales bacterium]